MKCCRLLYSNDPTLVCSYCICMIVSQNVSKTHESHWKSRDKCTSTCFEASRHRRQAKERIERTRSLVSSRGGESFSGATYMFVSHSRAMQNYQLTTQTTMFGQVVVSPQCVHTFAAFLTLAVLWVTPVQVGWDNWQDAYVSVMYSYVFCQAFCLAEMDASCFPLKCMSLLRFT